MAKKTFFISHVHEEGCLAESIKDTLEYLFADQVDVFLSEGIDMGKNWFSEIKSKLLDCGTVITLFSPFSSNRKPWIHIESGYAMMSDVDFIPILHSGFKLDSLLTPYSLNKGFQIMDDDGIKKFIEDIAKDLGLLSQNFIENLPSYVSKWKANTIKAMKKIKLPPYLMLPIGEEPFVWVVGSYRGIGNKDKLKYLVYELAQMFYKNSIGSVLMCSSELLSDFANEYQRVEMSQQAGSECPSPIMLFKYMPDEINLQSSFKKMIGRAPDMVLMLGGYKEETSQGVVYGDAYKEYQQAIASEMAVLSLQFTGGAAADCSSTFDSSLSTKIKSLSDVYNASRSSLPHISKIVYELLIEQQSILKNKRSQ